MNNAPGMGLKQYGAMSRNPKAQVEAQRVGVLPEQEADRLQVLRGSHNM
jgi:hypothetical protein